MKVKLKDCVLILDNQRIPLSSKEREKLKKIFPYYGAQGIIDYVDDYIFDGKYILVAEDGNNLKTLNEPIAKYIEGKFWVNNHAHILSEKEGYNLQYVYYLLNSIDITKYVTGSAQPKLNQANLSNIEIEMPDRNTQDKIVEILSNIDNQIERNNEMVKRLQVLGNTIFSVYFSNCKDYCGLTDFPYAEIIKPGIDKFETKKHYIATAEVNGDILNFNAPLINYHGRESRANMQPIIHSVWFAKLKNSVKHIYVSKNDDLLVSDYIFSTGFCGLECDEIAYEFLIGFIELPYFELMKDKLSHGATMESVNNEDLSSIKIPLPSKEQLEEYHNNTKDIYEQISMLKVENYKLNLLKAKLLPLLINGQLEL